MNDNNLKPFKPGDERINREGRPKKLPAIDDLLAEVLGEGDKAKLILEAVIRRAMKGDVRAAEVLMDRGWGKAKQQVQIDQDVNITFKTEVV